MPFELVKIRLQDQSSSQKYKGVFDCATQIRRESGLLGFYRGFESTIWWHIVWNAGYFDCIFKVRSLLPEAKTKDDLALNQFIAGSVGGAVGTILNTPLGVVKSRIQRASMEAGGGSTLGLGLRYSMCTDKKDSERCIRAWCQRLSGLPLLEG